MKMNTILAGLAGLLLTACTEDLVEQKPSVVSSNSLRVEVIDNLAITRANYSGFPATTFEENDAIGVYAFDGSSYVVSNVRFVKQSDGSWTPDEEVPYNEDYTYYAYFPYRSTVYTPSTSGTVDDIDTKFGSFISDASNYFWQANQSTKARFTNSNLMIAKGMVTAADKKTATVKFTMAHKRGLAIIGNAPNKWYYTDTAGTKYTATPVFNGTDVPYDEGGTLYYLVKPDVNTSAFGQTINLPAGEYKSCPIKLTGTPTYTYKVYHYGQSSTFSTSKPSWLTVTPNVVDGEPTELAVTVTNSTSTTYSKGSGNSRNVLADVTLKAASPVSDVDLSMVDNAGSARASRTTANCYLVHAPGTYKIPLVYGNAIKNGNEASTAAFYTSKTSNTLQRLVNHADAGITSPWIKTQLGSCPDGAQLIWEDVKGMISSVGIDTSENGYLTFTVDADNIAEGNAVIAATLSGTVVWSWHVWVTTQTLSGLTIIATGSHNYQVAPVNVGQITGSIVSGATIYAGDICTVTCTNNGVSMEFTVTAKDYAYGGTTYYNPSPYYQWGRKDAMYPSTGGYNSAGTLISTYSGTTLVTATSATPGATIQHPNYWYYNSSNYEPYGTNSTYAGKYNYWDMKQTSNGNITTATVKTVYDPCPPGFCVPTSNLWSFINNEGSSSGKWDSTNKGRLWLFDTPEVFFPASGRRNGYGSSVGSLEGVGYHGSYWSASASDSNRSTYLYLSSALWNFSNYPRAYGFSVRAVAEE